MPVEAARAVAPLPPPLALELGQDRLVEKQLFQRLGIPTARFGSLADSGLPALVKSRRLGYDGKGQRRVALDEELGEHELAEEIVPFDRELSIIAVRGRDGETRFWPLAENVHRDGILRISRSPAVAAPQAEAEELSAGCSRSSTTSACSRSSCSRSTAGCLPTSSRRASTTRATGRSTVRSRASSRTTCGRSSAYRSASTDALAPAVMLNLIGGAPASEKLLELPGAHLHLYGKAPRPGRKIGHVTLVGASEETVAEATALVEGSADG